MLDFEFLRQRPDQMIQFVAYQHDRPARLLPSLELLQSPGVEPGQYDVVEILLAKQVQPVATHAAQRQMHQPGGKPRVLQRHHRSKQPQTRHSTETVNTLRKGLGIPCQVSRQAKRPQREEQPFGAQKNKLGFSRFVFPCHASIIQIGIIRGPISTLLTSGYRQ